MKVLLLSHTPQPEKLVSKAAKLCYSSLSIEEIGENQSDEQIQKFVKMLADMGHESPLEHINFTFAIEGVSRSLLAQLTRHRIASYSVQSQRYVKNSTKEYIIPPEIEAIPEAKSEFLKAIDTAYQSYASITEILKSHYTEKASSSDSCHKTQQKNAEKLAIEDARYILPNACTTKLICTFNARSLLNFFKHRCCNRAQWEIRSLAWNMLDIVKTIAPSIFATAGPTCIYGKCSEGKMSCGNPFTQEDL